MNSQVMIGTVLPLVLLILLMWLLLIRPQRKREKEVNAMRANLHVGDEIITIGGICGKIVKTKEDSIVIQVGADKIKFEMMRWSVSKVVDSVEQKNIKKTVADDVDDADVDDEEVSANARPKRLERQSDADDVAEESGATAVDAEEADE